MKVRTSYKGFTDRADAYLEQVFLRVADLQFTKGDGPIIALQVFFGSLSYIQIVVQV